MMMNNQRTVRPIRLEIMIQTHADLPPVLSASAAWQVRYGLRLPRAGLSVSKPSQIKSQDESIKLLHPLFSCIKLYPGHCHFHLS